MTEEQKAQAILLCGYVRGLCSKLNQPVDATMLKAFEKLEVPERFLYVVKSKVNRGVK